MGLSPKLVSSSMYCQIFTSHVQTKRFWFSWQSIQFIQDDVAYIKNLILITRQLLTLNTSLSVYWKTAWEEIYVHASYPKTA